MGVERVVSETVNRIRWLRALEAAVVFAIFGFGATALVLISFKWNAWISDPDLWLASPALFPLTGALIGWFRPLPRLHAARLLDRAYRLHDRISSAHCFNRLAPEERTAFMDACIEDAGERAPHLRPSAVVRLRASRRWMALAVAGLAVAAIAEVERPVKRPVFASPPPQSALLHEDDIESLQSEIEEAEVEEGEAQKVRPGLEAFNQLVRAIAESRISYPDAIRRVGELDEQLKQSLSGHLDELEQELRLAGKRLGRTGRARPLSDALREADAERARRELDRLARELQRGQQAGRAGLRRLRQALGPGRMKSQKRELQRLDRGQRELDRLSRHLNDAAGALARRDAERAARALDSAGQRLHRIAGEQREARALERLRGRLAELRDTLRWQQQRRSGRAASGGATRELSEALGLQRFARLARGQVGTKSGDSEREQGARASHELAVSGVDSQKRAGRQASLARVRTAPGSSRASSGSAAGTGTASERLKRPSRASVSHRDGSPPGEQREGPVRSQVIPQSADRGFVSKAYQRVYSDYRNHAESVLERDVVPPGYRFYVKRYFRLIRPR